VVQLLQRLVLVRSHQARRSLLRAADVPHSRYRSPNVSLVGRRSVVAFYVDATVALGPQLSFFQSPTLLASGDLKLPVNFDLMLQLTVNRQSVERQFMKSKLAPPALHYFL